VEERLGGTPAAGEQGEKVFVARAGEHRRQADENVAVVDPGIEVMTLAERQQAEVDHPAVCRRGRRRRLQRQRQYGGSSGPETGIGARHASRRITNGDYS
jgi:hypothetical protein